MVLIMAHTQNSLQSPCGGVFKRAKKVDFLKQRDKRMGTYDINLKWIGK
jgi:hypothetical protein